MPYPEFYSTPDFSPQFGGSPQTDPERTMMLSEGPPAAEDSPPFSSHPSQFGEPSQTDFADDDLSAEGLIPSTEGGSFPHQQTQFGESPQTDFADDDSASEVPPVDVEGGTLPLDQTQFGEPPQTDPEETLDAGRNAPATPPQPREPSPAPRSRSSQPRMNIVAIGDRPTVQTDAEKAHSDHIDLVESMRSGRILTGTIHGIEEAEGKPIAVIYHGDWKIMIPAEQAVVPPTDADGHTPRNSSQYLLMNRLGAEVDYLVKGIDAKHRIAVASRLEAMRAKRREYYFGRDRSGNDYLFVGACAEARVVCVISAGIFVDLFGAETYIPLRELSYQRMSNASSQYQTGQRVLVRILELDKNRRSGSVTVTASVKQAMENPYEKALRRYSPGNCYVGTVSMVDTSGVFVALDGGVDCLCQHNRRGRPPRGSRVTVRIAGIDSQSNRIWGYITHAAAMR